MPKAAESKLISLIRDDDPIIKYGDPVLRQVAAPVAAVGEEMVEFVVRMKQIMSDANGVGLAAPQLGILKRVIVYDSGEGLEAMINPKIVRASGEQTEPNEGCLSIPGLRGTVRRAEEIIVKALDEHGQSIRIHAEGFPSRVIQHEIDHLDGVLFIDRADPESLHWLTAEEIEQESAEDEQIEE